MLKIHSEPTPPMLSPSGQALLALGFRPFFALAGIAAVILLTLWLGIWSGGLPAPAYYGSVGWHSHEMLFGYTSAVIAGFLLTAVRNWTGVNTPSGWPLLLLALLWLAGRLMPALSGVLPPMLIALVDLAFLPALALVLAPPLWQGKQGINRIFVPLLLVMAIANLLVHLQYLGITNTGGRGIDSMLYLVILLVTLLGGRVIPFFTQAVIPGFTARSWIASEIAATASITCLVLTQLLYPTPWLTGPLAAVAAVTHAVRIYGWHHPGVWRIPILWVLYTALFWIVIGLVLTAFAAAGVVTGTLAKHALTVGGIGVATFGMMARVILGHTGRPIQPHKLVELGFILLNLAAALRVFGPIIAPEYYTIWVHLSGGIWIICFLLFSAIYLPMLARPRLDGKPG